MPCVTYSSPHTFSNALSPAQAAVASACLGIITSKDGDALRARLMANILHLRQRLDQAGPTDLRRALAHRLRADGQRTPGATLPHDQPFLVKYLTLIKLKLHIHLRHKTI